MGVNVCLFKRISHTHSIQHIHLNLIYRLTWTTIEKVNSEFRVSDFWLSAKPVIKRVVTLWGWDGMLSPVIVSLVRIKVYWQTSSLFYDGGHVYTAEAVVFVFYKGCMWPLVWLQSFSPNQRIPSIMIISMMCIITWWILYI